MHTSEKILLAALLASTLVLVCFLLISDPIGLSEPSGHPLYYFKDQIEKFNATATDIFKNQLVKKINSILTSLKVGTKDFKAPLSHRELQTTLDRLDDILRSLQYPVARAGYEGLGELYNKDVCQEKYSSKRLAGQDSSFFDQGYRIEKCNGVPEFSTLLTLVYNFVHYDGDDLQLISELLTNVNKEYPNIEIIAAIPMGFSMPSKLENVTLLERDLKVAETDIWNSLIARINTKYVYIGRNAVHFSRYDRLERLVREINNLNVQVVAGAFRTLHGGQWSDGCEQSMLQNYTLVYERGYDLSIEGCMLCHHVQGPFVAKTELFNRVPLKSSVTATSGFSIWFLNLTQTGNLLVSCPDSMSYSTDKSQIEKTKDEWIDLARFLQVEKIYPARGSVIEFGCNEAQTTCSKTKAIGLALSHCCMGQLRDMTKMVLAYCKEKEMMCEIEDGTLLGAIKFNGMLPWEFDSDITLNRQNFTSFNKQLGPLISKKGYKFETHDEGKYFEIRSPEWFVEVFTINNMDSEKLAADGIGPTMIFYDGIYVPTPKSPGLYVRNRYGKEVYQHVLHWRHNNKKSGWSFYDAGQFLPCSKPGHHACLNRYVADGNLQFKEPVR